MTARKLRVITSPTASRLTGESVPTAWGARFLEQIPSASPLTGESVLFRTRNDRNYKWFGFFYMLSANWL